MLNHSRISALVINLTSATARWEFQKKQLEMLNITHQRIEATTTDDLTNEEYEKWANHWQRKLRRTEVACFLSHYRVWQKIVKEKRAFLVLEDDALLSKHLPEALRFLENDQSITYDHITFETRGRKKLIAKQSILESEYFSLHTLFLDKTGAAAYLLTPSGAKKLLDEVDKKGAALADALLCHTKALKKLQAVPALAIQMDMASHYEMPNLKQPSVAKSNISTKSNSKPMPNSLSDKLAFKSKRLAAQVDMGIIQAKYSNQSNYLEITPNENGFIYLAPLLKK